MKLTDNEKRILYQYNGYDKADTLYQIRSAAPYMPKEQREAAYIITRKLNELSEGVCMAVIEDVRANYHLPSTPKTVGELIAEARQKSGAAVLKGHDIMGLERFAPDTRHMIVFDVLSWDCSVGYKGDKMRLFLTDQGYKILLKDQHDGNIKIRNHANVLAGNLHYDHKDREL